MRLVNGKVVLRAIEEADNDVLKELINDPEVERMVVGWSFPSSNERQMQWYQSMFNDIDLSRVRYAIQFEGKCVGMAALHEIDYKNSHAGVDIKLVKNARNQGVGSASLNALIKYAFDELNLHCLISEILEDNFGSIKLFEKCGFRLEGNLRNRIYKDGQYLNLCVYSILKSEYLEFKNEFMLNQF